MSMVQEYYIDFVIFSNSLYYYDYRSILTIGSMSCFFLRIWSSNLEGGASYFGHGSRLSQGTKRDFFCPTVALQISFHFCFLSQGSLAQSIILCFDPGVG